MFLRCTRTAGEFIGVRHGMLVDAEVGDDDWYVNLLLIERRRCLLFVHAGTMFSVFTASVRKSDLKSLGAYVNNLIADELRAENLALDTFGDLTCDEITLAKTASRHVLGVMNDMVLHCRAVVDHSGGLDRCDIGLLNHRLRRVLHRRGGDYTTAIDLVGG